METNFEIEDNIALLFKGRRFDVHNNFDFVGFEHHIEKREVKMFWTRSLGDWVDAGESSGFVLVHTEVYFLKTEYDNKKYEFPADDRCVDAISFFPSNDRVNNNGFITQAAAEKDDDIIYLFVTDSFIRVGCKAVTFQISS